MADKVHERRPEEAEDNGAEEAEGNELPAGKEPLEAGRHEAGVGLVHGFAESRLRNEVMQVRGEGEENLEDEGERPGLAASVRERDVGDVARQINAIPGETGRAERPAKGNQNGE